MKNFKTLFTLLTILAAFFVVSTINAQVKLPQGSVPNSSLPGVITRPTLPVTFSINPTITDISAVRIPNTPSTPAYSKRMRFTITLKNTGNMNYVSNSNQQGITCRFGENFPREAKYFEFGNLNAGETKTFSFEMDWYYPEFPPSLRATILYDPDIRIDGNDQNNDSKLGDNSRTMTGEQINVAAYR